MNFTYFKPIDTLRFFAALLVCLSHWLPQELVKHFQLGRLGVELFFVISGFLITRNLLRLNEKSGFKFSTIKTFFIRRVLRIFPVYYFVVLLTYIFHDGHFKDAIFWNLAYCSNFYMLEIEKFPGIMSHFWSLSVEEHFYLFWPFVILLFNRSKVIYAILTCALIGILSRYYFYLSDFPSIYPKIFSFSCFDAFAVGGIMAFLFIYHTELYRKLRDSNFILIIVFTGLILSLYFDYQIAPSNVWDFIYIRIFASMFSFFLISRSMNSKSKILNNKHLILFGKLSYSMYLFHNFIPGFLLGVKYPDSVFLRVFLYFIVLILVSYLAWRIIELPFNKLKKRFDY